MRSSSVLGYLVSAFLYLMAWLNPSFLSGKKLIQWVSFEKLGLAEFLSMHAATLLGAVSMSAVEEADPNIQKIFWALISFYAVLGGGAYLLHRDHGVLLGFYLMLAIRGLNLISMRHGDVDMMRAQVLKNMVMTFAMMLMVAGMVMSDEGAFDSDSGRKIGAAGRPVIFVVGYYLIWALIEWKWPVRIAK